MDGRVIHRPSWLGNPSCRRPDLKTYTNLTLFNPHLANPHLESLGQRGGRSSRPRRVLLPPAPKGTLSPHRVRRGL